MKKNLSLANYLSSDYENKWPTSTNNDARSQSQDSKTSSDRILDANNLPNLYGSFDKTKVLHDNTGIDFERGRRRRSSGGQKDVVVADIIGSFGWFQFIVLLFSGLRESTVGYDAVVMSIILQPEEEFTCADKIPSGAQSQLYTGISNETLHLNNLTMSITNETFHCYQSLNGKTLLDELGRPMQCSSWSFPEQKYGASLITEWSLVCHKHWLVAFIQSAYFFGLVTGNLAWGYTADKIGRRKAYLISHTISLAFGWLALIAPNIWTFTCARFLCAFGSIGYNIIYSIQVELIGTKHRAFSTILNHLGWGSGVILVPIVDHMFSEYHPIISVAPVVTLLMFPWAFWLPESSRWLMANERYAEARGELIRAARFNGRSKIAALEKKITFLEDKTKNDKILAEAAMDRASCAGNAASVREIILGNPILLRDTIILSSACFAGHLFYYLLTINFGYVKNLSTDANFIISGVGEWFCVVTGALLLKFCTRKTCMSLFLFLMALSFTFQSFIDAEVAPSLDTQVTISINNGIGTLSALLLVFITLIVNQEIFPTVVRQRGSSFVNTIGEFGSTLAPLVIQFGLLIGPWRANVMYAVFCLLSMIGVQYLTKTDDIDLPDN